MPDSPEPWTMKVNDWIDESLRQNLNSVSPKDLEGLKPARTEQRPEGELSLFLLARKGRDDAQYALRQGDDVLLINSDNQDHIFDSAKRHGLRSWFTNRLLTTYDRRCYLAVERGDLPSEKLRELEIWNPETLFFPTHLQTRDTLTRRFLSFAGERCTSRVGTLDVPESTLKRLLETGSVTASLEGIDPERTIQQQQDSIPGALPLHRCVVQCDSGASNWTLHEPAPAPAKKPKLACGEKAPSRPGKELFRFSDPQAAAEFFMTIHGNFAWHAEDVRRARERGLQIETEATLALPSEALASDSSVSGLAK